MKIRKILVFDKPSSNSNIEFGKFLAKEFSLEAIVSWQQPWMELLAAGIKWSLGDNSSPTEVPLEHCKLSYIEKNHWKVYNIPANQILEFTRFYQGPRSEIESNCQEEQLDLKSKEALCSFTEYQRRTDGVPQELLRTDW